MHVKFAMGAALVLMTSATPAFADPNWAAVGQALGKPGTELPGGVYRVALPRTDLKVTLDGIAIKPALALGSWLAFQAMGDNAMVMGDLVLTQEEVNPVLRALRENGIEVTAVHNHMLNDQPRLFFMHFWANDDAVKLAGGLRAALDKMNLAKG